MKMQMLALMLIFCSACGKTGLPTRFEIPASESEILPEINRMPPGDFVKNTYPFLEGYCPVDIMDMKTKNRFRETNAGTVETSAYVIGAAVSVYVGGLIIFPRAYTQFQPGHYGYVYDVEIRYNPLVPRSKDLIAHEMLHARGYAGGPEHGGRSRYAVGQLAEMLKDGVTRFVDTKWYKSRPEGYAEYFCPELWKNEPAAFDLEELQEMYDTLTTAPKIQKNGGQNK